MDKESIFLNETNINKYALRDKTCCFTEHRPQKLSWNFDNSSNEFLRLSKSLEKSIKKAINCGYRIFISGMALGFDTLCAETVLKFKNIYPEIKLVCAIPCKEQDKYWSDLQKDTYKKILCKADKVEYISEKYTRFCMRKRNEYMLKNSSLLIAFFDGKEGGTKMTVDIAKKMNIHIDIIEF